MERKILFVSLLVSFFSVFFFSSSAYAVSGDGYSRVVDMWTTYQDYNGLHQNHHDGVVNLPANILTGVQGYMKVAQNVHLQLNYNQDSYVGSSQNVNNTIIYTFSVTGRTGFYNESADPYMVFKAHTTSGRDETGTCSHVMYGSGNSAVRLICAVTLSDYNLLTGFDFWVNGTEMIMTTWPRAIFYLDLTQTQTVVNVSLSNISYKWDGSTDPNVALNSERNRILQEIADQHQEDIDRENAKQQQLEQQSSGLGVSANNTGNPFANLFNATGCQSMPTVSGWFNHSPAFEICSPYPSGIGGVIKFVGSAVVVGLLIRLYYKKMKGGFDG